MAVPLTKEAAAWWGKGTRWCTASETYSYFDRYNRKAPLIVLLFPKGLEGAQIEQNGLSSTPSGVRKFQLWVTRSNSDSNLYSYQGKIDFYG